MANPVWKLADPLKELDEHLENAYKRVEGIIGFQVSRDRFNTDTLSGIGRDMLDNGLSPGPLFMRIGAGARSALGYRPKNALSLKELAADILNEFYSEALAAFQSNKVRLYKEAESFLEKNLNSPSARQAALEAAEKSFLDLSREDMTKAAMPHVKETMSAGTVGIIGGFAGLGLGIAIFKHPLFGIIGALIGAAVSYSMARDRGRKKAQEVLLILPKDLYTLFKAALTANQSRYQDIINSAAARD